MTRTIRWRLTIPYALLVIVTMVGLSIYLISYVRGTYQDNLKQSLVSEAHLVADAVQPRLASGSDQASLAQQTMIYAQRLGARVTVIDPTGNVLAESQANPQLMDNHLSRPEVQGALRGQDTSEIRYSDTLHMDMLYVAVPIQNSGKVVGIARLSVSLQSIEDNLSRIRQTVTLATLSAILLTVIVSALLSGYTIRPLQRLTEMAHGMTHGDFASTTLTATHDEIGELNKAFTQMAIRLRDQIQALETEQGKLEAVLAHMTDGVLIVDETSRVELINPAAQRMFEVGEETAIRRSVVEVIRHHQLVDLVRKCQATGEQQITTLELSAEKLFLQAIATSLKQAIPGNTLLLVQDLTRLRRLETVRQDFISNVSHELRTPLASLKALTETLQETALNDPPAARRFLSRMDTEIDTLTQMVQELLELSRIESGRVPLRRQSLAPRRLVSHAVERMSAQAERAGLRLCLECPEDLPPVSADPERMEQVLVNLLHNAVKFTPPGGEIVVSAVSEDGRVVFSVRDTGVGIASKDLPRIFERFYKADRARSGGGTGLGLSISRHIVETHGGKIWAESVQGAGSTFYFSLPTAKVELAS
jgi:two-component system, OmpR family, phosphate regulon sensor histidine kinase PhoR